MLTAIIAAFNAMYVVATTIIVAIFIVALVAVLGAIARRHVYVYVTYVKTGRDGVKCEYVRVWGSAGRVETELADVGHGVLWYGRGRGYLLRNARS